MELHLPCLILRENQACSAAVGCGKIQRDTKPWADLSFLDQHICEVDLARRSIYATHATIVVSGWEPTKYTALSFVDAGPVIESWDDDHDEESEESEGWDTKLLPDDMEDEFGTYGSHGFSRINNRNWDPRVCFLRAVEVKITVAWSECRYLIGYLENIEKWVQYQMSLFQAELTVIRLRFSFLEGADRTARTVRAIKSYQNAFDASR